MPLPVVPPGLSDRADSDRDAIASQLSTIQPTVLTEEGRYMQVLPSPIPSNGADIDMDLSVKPPDRDSSPYSRGLTAATRTPIGWAIDEYQSPSGPGYLLRQFVRLSGDLWERVIHLSGPESWIGQDWSIS